MPRNPLYSKNINYNNHSAYRYYMKTMQQVVVGLRSQDLWKVFSQVQQNKANIDPDFVKLVESEVVKRVDRDKMWCQ